MIRILRNVETKWYVRLDGGYTKERRDARHFQSFDEIWEVVRHYQLKEMEIIFSRGDERHDVVLPYSDDSFVIQNAL